MNDDVHCEYFSSTEWKQRLNRYVARAWDFETFLRRADGRKYNTELFESIATEFSEQDANDVAMMSVGTIFDANPPALDATINEVRAAWEQTADLPETCPHSVHKQHERFCMCHMPPDARREADIGEETIRLWLESRLNEGGEQEKRFVGARFERLDLSNVRFTTPDNYPLDFRFLEITEELNCQDAVFGVDVLCKGGTFVPSATTQEGQVEFGDHFVDFYAEIDFTRAVFEGKADFKFAEFGAGVSFNSAVFERAAMFNYAHFRGRADYMSGSFHGKADFSKARFERAAFMNGEYQDAAIFNYTTFDEQVDLWKTPFHDKAEFWATNFHGDLNGRYVQFLGEVRFTETEFSGKVTFESSEFTKRVRFRRVEAVEPVCLRDAELAKGVIKIILSENPTIYDLRQAELGNVELQATGTGTKHLFEHLLISETNFDGFDFAAYNNQLKPDWTIHTNNLPGQSVAVNDNPGTLEATYLKAKTGAKAVGHNKAASEFFFHEMRFRRKQHAKLAVDTFPLTGERSLASAGKFAVALIKWTSNATLGATAGYGERPRNVIGSSLVIILLFAGVYALLDSGGTGGMQYLLLSFQSFITFILGGDPEQPTFAIELLSTIEGFVGAFLIALLVFTLTRSIHR